MPEIRPARIGDLVLLPEIERRSDTLFDQLGIGPLPPPGSVTELAAALVVLVAGDPVQGFARIEALARDAHLEQLAVDPSAMRQGIGRALVRAASDWARDAYGGITLVTYRDVPWNGPFYASEGFVELGAADEWYAGLGLPPEDPVLGRFGTRIVMRRRL
ncbi:MAG TPA: GNAT family N-acetyltransferase [Acidimicrobiales bacterium]|jgi:GNAT superfamily N-acetyltransferase